MKLILKCRECGKRTVVPTKKPIACEDCGNTKWFCFKCKKESDYEDSHMCSRCRWFICPHCGACGCNIREVDCPNCGTHIKASEIFVLE